MTMHGKLPRLGVPLGANHVDQRNRSAFELEWVLLQPVTAMNARTFTRFFLQLLETTNVTVEDEAQTTALAWYGDGADFADALHLARTQSRGVMLTFDAAFASLRNGKRRRFGCCVQLGNALVHTK